MLNDQSINYHNAQFFKNCANDLKGIAQQSKINQIANKNLRKLQRIQNVQEQNSQQQAMMNNIVIDYLRTKNYNYCYSMLMKETQTKSQDLVSNSVLAQLMGVHKQMQNQNKFRISVLQGIILKLGNFTQMKQTQEIGINVELLTDTSDSLKNTIILQNRLKEVRKQIQDRQHHFYLKQLENIRAVQLIEKRQQLKKEYEYKYRQDKRKHQKQLHSLVQKYKKSMDSGSSHLAQQNQKNIQKNKILQQQCRKLRETNKQLNTFKISHRCVESQEYKQLAAQIRTQRKQMELKKRELELALKNINTKVQELVISKNRVLFSQKGTQKFMNMHLSNKTSKNHMIETIYAEMKRAVKRSEAISAQNLALRGTISQLKQKIKQLALQKQNINTQNQNSSQTYPKRNPNGKFETKTVMTGVKQTDFQPQNQNLQQQVQSQYDQEYFDDQMRHNQKLTEIKSEMWKIKNRIHLIVKDVFE